MMPLLRKEFIILFQVLSMDVQPLGFSRHHETKPVDPFVIRAGQQQGLSRFRKFYNCSAQKWNCSTRTVALCAFKFFFENTIKCPRPALVFIRPECEKKLPVVVSRDEVREILSNIQLFRAKFRDALKKEICWLLPNT
jgi:integrase